MRPNQPSERPRFSYHLSSTGRIKLGYVIILLLGLLFTGRLFYLQVIKHDFYRQAALADQLKEYSIPAERGVIEAKDGSSIVPLVLNQKLYTIYADPSFTGRSAASDATQIARVLGGKASNYQALLSTSGSRYEVLGKRHFVQMQAKLLALKLPGVGAQGQDYRVYPQGDLAAQLLGFVDDEGRGQYGLEQYMNSQLAGKPGTLKAITDASGVPLSASPDNVQVDPMPGQKVVLTIDLAMQKQLEDILKAGIAHAEAPSGDALVLDVSTGAVKAMACWPTYNPAQFYNVKNPSLFKNTSVDSPLEIGSIMKALTMSAALDQGLVTPNSSYYDPSQWTLDGSTIHDVEASVTGTQTMKSLLNLSLNTGATWLLMQMGGGQINQRARDTWHDYMVNRYQLGRLTGIEQGYEASGYIPNPERGASLNLTYANTAFGQSMTATPLQMAAALASVVNGGTYYQPHLVDQTTDNAGRTSTTQPKVVDPQVVKPSVAAQIESLMEYVLVNHYPQPPFPKNYIVGGKTGTAQLASPNGGYYKDRYNGTFYGFVGGNKPQYVIMVRVNTPGIGGFAGTTAAMPIFVNLAHMLINNFNVLPKS